MINHSGNTRYITVAQAEKELTWACLRVKRNINKFGNGFPSACTKNNCYDIKGNNDWTNGFWTGMQAIAFEFTGDNFFKSSIEENLVSFHQRIKDNIVLNHHDIGFLYSLSAVAWSRITGLEYAEIMAKEAAGKLVERFHDNAGFIQAWGEMDNPHEYRLIIDSLINLPLLYSVSESTGETHWRDIALRHFDNVIKHIFRADNSSYHTYFFNRETGQPSHGETFQGFNHHSCWARGQAWAILGLPLNWSRGRLPADAERYRKICEYFINHLPADGVPYWDLVFTQQDGQPRDSSSSAIAACGLLEAEKLFPEQGYSLIAHGLLKSLIDTMTSRDDQQCDGLLKHGVYAYSQGKGIDECNLWGDYFYMEALWRICNPAWRTYW